MDETFTKIASKCARVMGQPQTFIIAILLVILWGASGPLLAYSDTWQLIVNTATTVMTFLAVFLIQNSQNRDGAAMQAKLDEILRSLDKAREEFVGIEHLTDNQIEAIRHALEADIRDAEGRERLAVPTVERLLDRY